MSDVAIGREKQRRKTIRWFGAGSGLEATRVGVPACEAHDRGLEALKPWCTADHAVRRAAKDGFRGTARVIRRKPRHHRHRAETVKLGSLGNPVQVYSIDEVVSYLAGFAELGRSVVASRQRQERVGGRLPTWEGPYRRRRCGDRHRGCAFGAARHATLTECHHTVWTSWVWEKNTL
jgi:hypothetical protein